MAATVKSAAAAVPVARPMSEAGSVAPVKKYAGLRRILIAEALRLAEGSPQPWIDLVRVAQIQRALGDIDGARDTLDHAARLAVRPDDIDMTGQALYQVVAGMLRSGFISEEESLALLEKGSVGHICCYHYDARGSIEPFDVNGRVIGVSAERLKAIPLRVAIACGARKAEAIAGALRGGFLSVLVTDEAAALRIVNHPPA